MIPRERRGVTDRREQILARANRGAEHAAVIVATVSGMEETGLIGKAQLAAALKSGKPSIPPPRPERPRTWVSGRELNAARGDLPPFSREARDALLSDLGAIEFEVTDPFQDASHDAPSASRSPHL